MTVLDMQRAHPGEILRDEMDERGLSPNALARITAILNGQQGVSQDTFQCLPNAPFSPS